LRNDHTNGLLNGQFVNVNDVMKKDDNLFFACIRIGEQTKLGARRCYTGHFADHVKHDKERANRDWKIKRSMIELDFGYAIACHKAQGSGFGNIVIIDDGWDIGGMHSRWLYTAITRAENGLILIARA